MASGNYDTDILLPLHHHIEFQPKCADLLNQEWPRSHMARLHSLDKSCDELPTHLLLVDEKASPTELIGHSCLCPLPNDPKGCWIQSVVVDTRFRGMGYGKRLMLASEHYAREKFGFDTMYLSTHDKHEFYLRLGYEECPPVINVGSNSSLFNKKNLRKFTEQIANDTKIQKNSENSTSTNLPSANADTESELCGTAVPPPPPPPLPAPDAPPVFTFMKKRFVHN